MHLSSQRLQLEGMGVSVSGAPEPPMWNFEALLPGNKRWFETGTWSEMRNVAALAVLEAHPAERPTILALLNEAQPDKPWSCSGQNSRLRIWPDAPLPKDDPVSVLPDHGEREHADLGASSSHRWWNCAGCLNLQRKVKPPERSNEHADRGTAAHQIAHACLLSGQEAIEWIDRTTMVRDVPHMVTEKMADDVQRYLDLCRSFMKPGWECFTERRFNLKKLQPPGPMFGTADFCAYSLAEAKLVIIDYKNGVLGVPATSPQLKYYVLGVLCMLPETVKINVIEVYIVQPNDHGVQDKVKKATYNIFEIFEWSLELMERAKATMEPDAPLKAGSWCKFCPNSGGYCQTQTDAAMEAAQLEFAAEVPGELPAVTFNQLDPRTLSPAQLSALMQRFPEVEGFMTAVKEVARALIENGVDVPDFKVVQGLGHRAWIDPDDVANKLISAYQMAEKDIWIRELISPAAVEKILRPKLRELGIRGKAADEMLAKSLGSLTRRPMTAPRLARDSDSLPRLPARGEEFTVDLPAPDVADQNMPAMFN